MMRAILRPSRIMGGVVFLGILFVFNHAFAAELGTCDPEQDPNNCECTEAMNEYGVCNQVDLANFVSPDDPETLRLAAEMDTIYDEEADEYVVFADATNFNGGGILPTRSNGAEWSSLDALQEYLSILLDVPREEDGSLPTVRFYQQGHISKFDQATDQWAPYQYDNLILDAISGPEGDIDVPLSGHSWSTVYNDFDGGTQQSGLLKVEQGAYLTVDKLTTQAGFDFHFGKTQSFNQDVEYNGTKSQRLKITTSSGNTLFLVFWVKLDKVWLENQHFNGGTPRFQVQSRTVMNGPTFELGFTYPFTNTNNFIVWDGLCAAGYAEKDGYVVNGNYSVGTVQSSDPLCP